MVGGKTNQIEQLRLGVKSFASKLMESSRFEISKLVRSLLCRTVHGGGYYLLLGGIIPSGFDDLGHPDR